ncbi:hypothetical protein ACK28Q_42345 [Bradyrhizobium japonicum]|uniref:hypothetical protein n=1 Tax=Bradyrhizobium TaxID=374 RepID=UPI000AAB85C2|nr:hypothetical protein [Bradyrhizobium japonicum]MCS3535527.1 hypothetical protein [Bradyrhizobium japonicum]MCS3988375.1 hypothetical protein [Bradyrhizobium japonicum]MCS4016808.1 hypothetical protein [Bradyrhizobium japonicum]MCS4203904.1 hypothetical protein [Bradyrhizobium japonicum]MDH6179080.1 hypothetical protein [Bradyrhizobium japonicum]
MGHVNLKFWRAWESPEIERRRGDDFDISKRTLIVTGKVEVEAATTPALEEVAGRSDEPTVLYLNFPAYNYGTSWKPVWFQKEIRSGTYEKVRLLVDGHSASGGGLDIEKLAT